VLICGQPHCHVTACQGVMLTDWAFLSLSLSLFSLSFPTYMYLSSLFHSQYFSLIAVFYFCSYHLSLSLNFHIHTHTLFLQKGKAAASSSPAIPWKTLEDLVTNRDLRELTSLLKEVGVDKVMEVRNPGGKNILHIACEKEVLQVLSERERKGENSILLDVNSFCCFLRFFRLRIFFSKWELIPTFPRKWA
jgi:hypothetical protein